MTEISTGNKKKITHTHTHTHPHTHTHTHYTLKVFKSGITIQVTI